MIGTRLEVSERALNIILQIVYVESICMYMYTEPLLHSTSFLALGSAGTMVSWRSIILLIDLSS